MATNMFDNYQITPENYTPTNSTETITPNTPKFPLVAYNKAGDVIGYTWNYGDSIILEFNTSGNVVYDDLEFTEDADTYLHGKKFKIQLFNTRCEEVAHCECDASTTVRILSDSFYPSSVVKGTYHLKLTLVDENENVLTTLIGWDDGIIYIK